VSGESIPVEGTSLCLKKGVRAGGQAVIEGVMMRSPRFFSIAVRRQDGKIVLREERWRSMSERAKSLSRPVFRGVSTLVETIVNGVQALSFSADIAAKEEEAKSKDASSDEKSEAEEPKKKQDKGLSQTAIALTILSAFALAIAFFVVLPHVLTLFFGRLLHWQLDVSSLAFHVIDGAIKIIILIAYIWAISLIKDVRRVFEYHGAEHKSIFAYEKAVSLSVNSAREFGTHHPRCGTSFLLVVLIISIFLFAAVFPFFPRLSGLHFAIRQTVFMLVKIILLFPIAGISYEVIRAASKSENPLLKILVWPGVALQRITTQEPDDSQVEIALVALINVLMRESQSSQDFLKRKVRVFDDFSSALKAFEEEVVGSGTHAEA